MRRRWFSRASAPTDEEIARELRDHLELDAEELAAHGAGDDAPFAARRRFGNVSLALEATREAWGGFRWRRVYQDLGFDIAYAVRRLRHAPAFAALTVLTTAIGIGATTAIFSVVNAVVLRPIPVPDADHVVRIYETNPSNDSWTTSEPNYLDFRDRARTFAVMTALTGRNASLLRGGDPIPLSGLAATASYFTLFGGRPIVGSVYGPDNDRVGGDTRVVVLGEGVWRRVFGADPAIAGRVIDLDGVPYHVLGVMPVGYGYLPSDFWVPLAPDPASNRGNHLLFAFGRLQPGTTIAQANQDVRAVAAELSRLYPKSNGQWGARVESFLDSIVGAGLRRQLVLLLAAVSVLLLLACANVANLLLVRASTRQREMSVRAALGAGTARIVRQLLAESVVLSLLGAAVGLAMTWAAVPLIRRASAANVPRLDEVTMDARVLFFALGVAIVTGLVFGSAPAFHAARSDLQASLREAGRSVAGAGRRVRDTLVGIEVTLAVVLLVGAGLLGKSFAKLLRVPPGFATAGVLQLTVTAPNDLPREQRAAFFRRIDAALAEVPGVASVGASSIAPFSGSGTNTQFLAEGHESQPNDYFAADWRSVTPGFFGTLGVGLVRGRQLESTDDPGHPSVAVIDETMAARLWPGENPIGKHLMAAQSARTSKDRFEVVGVVRDIRDQSLAADPGPAVYFTEDQKPWIQLTFFVRSHGATATSALVDAIRDAFRAAAPTTPIPDITPLASNIDLALAPQRFTAWMLTGFAAVALLLAVIGLFGVVSFSVQQRAPEMGVRLAFGATPSRIVGMVMRDAGVVVGVGAAVGCVGAVFLSRFLSSMLFATATTDVPTYGAVVGVLIGAAALASYLPARRAARVDPLIAMRER
jgi:putative ABC transport system permease protein